MKRTAVWIIAAGLLLAGCGSAQEPVSAEKTEVSAAADETVRELTIDDVKDHTSGRAAEKEAAGALGALPEAAGTLSGSLSALNEGISGLSDGANTLSAGVNAYADGVGSLASGAADLSSGAGTLAASGSGLKEGYQELLDGINELKDGMVKFDEEGIKKLVDLVNVDLKGLTDRFDAVRDLGSEYTNFSGITDDTKGSVRFIFESDEIR